mgnify:CR=1 FL=1
MKKLQNGIFYYFKNIQLSGRKKYAFFANFSEE